MIMTNAERQRAYRERQAARKLLYPIYGERDALTASEFLEGAEFDVQEFYLALQDCGEETEEHIEERDAVWQEAYDEAWKEAYDAALEEAEDFDPDEDDDGDLRHHADEVARGEAEDAVRDWEQGLTDWNERTEYDIVDLMDAYRAAHRVLGT